MADEKDRSKISQTDWIRQQTQNGTKTIPLLQNPAEAKSLAKHRYSSLIYIKKRQCLKKKLTRKSYLIG